MNWYEIVGLLAAGGLVTSVAEYKFNYNLVDKLIDIFRSAESKIKNLEAKGAAVSKAISSLKSK